MLAACTGSGGERTNVDFGTGTTYYVDNCVTIGSDSNNGTSPTTPWLTTNMATTASGPVYFRSGCTWTMSSAAPEWVISGPFTIGSYGSGANPIINGYAGSILLDMNSQSNVTIENLTLNATSANTINIITTYGSTNGIYVLNSTITMTGTSRNYAISITPNHSASFPSIQNIYIEGNNISNSADSAIYFNGSDSDSIKGITISGNTIHDTAANGVYFFTPISLTSATLSVDAVNIANNTFTNIARSAISINSGVKSVSAQSYIQGNICNNLGSASQPNVNGLQLDFMQGVIVQNNYVNGVNTSAPDGDGIELDTAGSGSTLSTFASTRCIVRYNVATGANSFGGRTAGINAVAIKNSQIYDNIVYGNQIGFSFDTSIPTGNVFYNNTIVNNGYGVLETDATLGDGYPPASIWINNIYANNSAGGFIVANSNLGSMIPIESYNLWWNNGPYNLATYNIGSFVAVNLGTGDIIANPEFVNADGLYDSTADFNIFAGSPAISAGVNVGLTQDFAGNPVPSTPDIGAY